MKSLPGSKHMALRMPWKLSANLVEAGMDSPALEQLLGEIPPTAIADVLARVNSQLAAAKSSQ